MRLLAPGFLHDEYVGIPLEHNGPFRQFLRCLKAMSIPVFMLQIDGVIWDRYDMQTIWWL